MHKTIWGKLCGPYGVCLFLYASLTLCISLLQYTNARTVEFDLSLRGTLREHEAWGLYFAGVLLQPHDICTLWNLYFAGVHALHVT